MNESAKTTGFVLAAALMLALAILTYWGNQPPQIGDFANVGQPFFENFQSSKQAESLEVYALDATGKQRKFIVKKTNGLWTIPSHYGYPAEAADRLAGTAASLIGLTREALAGRLASEHERLGVIDPTSDAANDPETAGTRLVLKDSSGEALVDLIIGKKLANAADTPGADPFKSNELQTRYYLRRADENQTYQAALQLELSTKFTDWIDDQLLGVDPQKVKQVKVDQYELKEQAMDPLGQQIRLTMVPGTTLDFSRDTGFAPWKLEGVNPDTETMDVSKVNTFAGTISRLKIAGVRPKYRYEKQQLLTADLKLNRIPELEQNPEAFQRALMKMQQELSEYGFNVAPNPKNEQELMLVSEQGELTLATEDGIRYFLNFGKPLEGDETAIEIGAAGNTAVDGNPAAGTEQAQAGETPKPSGAADASAPAADTSKADATAADVPEPPTGSIKNRYVMIRVVLDAALLGPAPVVPVEPKQPEAPAGYTPPPAKPAGGEQGTEAAATAQAGETQDPARDPAFVAHDQALAEYERLKTTFELDQLKYAEDKKSYDEKVKRAETLVRELNERYGAWFYVVSGDDLGSLEVERSDFVQPKAAPPGGQPAPGIPAAPSLPPRPDIQFEEKKD